MTAKVIGYGQYIERNSDQSSFDIMYKSAKDAINMAGLEFSDIDGFIFSSPAGTVEEPLRSMLCDQFANYFGFKKLSYMDVIDFGGSSFNAMLYRAVKAVSDDRAKYVLAVGGGKGSIRKKDTKSNKIYERYYSKPINVREFLPISDYAILTNFYNKKYGATDEGRAMIAVRERENANHNEQAFFHGRLTVDDIIHSPIVSAPLHLLECASVSDGSTAFVISKRSISNGPEIGVIAYAETHDPRPLIERDNLLEIPSDTSILKAKQKAGISNRDLDHFMFYDAFTTMLMLQLESSGLAQKGKGWQFAYENLFGPEGEFPINTNGGTLNMSQPAFMSGGVILYEAFVQLGGLAKGRQVKNIHRSLINALGGIMNHSTTVILEAQ